MSDRPRGSGRIMKHPLSGTWFICYSVRGQERRRSVAKLLGKRPAECTEEDALVALSLRRRQAQSQKYADAPLRRMSFRPDTLQVAAKANGLLGPVPMVIDSTELAALCGPIVYAFFRHGEALYVGMSKNGLERPFGSHHAVGHIRREVGADDHLVIWPCVSIADALALERRAIKELRPSLNGRRLTDSADSTPETPDTTNA